MTEPEIPGTGGDGCCQVVELRQYLLKPGQRERLVELFERQFIESQEALGMRVIGLFREPRRPDWFVWLRGFPDMVSRARSLQAFYGESAAWRDHKEAANDTMIDSDNVLLLRPAGRNSGFTLPPPTSAHSEARDPRTIVAAIYSAAQPLTDEFAAWFESAGRERLRRGGMVALAEFVTESAANTFPRLPVRTGERVFIWFGAMPRAASCADVLRALEPECAAAGLRELQILELEPTSRSRLIG